MAEAGTPVEQLCAELIRFDTTNGGAHAKGEREAAEYVAEHLADAGLEPQILEGTPRRTNVVARVPGSSPHLAPILAQAHLDVVPADETDWSVPPFAGEIRDGFVWGRGATDIKDLCAMLLAVVDRWAAGGTVPQRDLVLAFVADEEDRGEHGAHWLVDAHPELFADCAAAIGESGGHTVHATATDGKEVRLYPVATAERGTTHLRLTATGTAGHGSRRNPDNAVTKLVNALSALATHPWPVRLTPAVEAFIERTGAALGVEVDRSDVDETLRRLGPAARIVENTVRNSTTPTVVDAGYKVNVIPSIAQALVDTRVLPGTEDELLAEVDRLIGPAVRREFLTCQYAVQAPIDSPWFAAMADALQAEDPGAVVVPFCLGGGTDAKAFSRLGIECYGFAPLLLPQDFDYHAMAHGVDERVPVDALHFGVNVLDRFLRSV